MWNLASELAERGRIPEPLIRWGIRRLIAERLEDEARAPSDGRFEIRDGGLADATGAANEQHYEVPAAFFERVLGPHLKYSCALWEPGTTQLGAAEEEMLALTCERAGLADGMRILELGCGWGSLSRFMARRYPSSRVLAISNSASQRAFIERDAPPNLEVRTVDVNALELDERFDRVVSVEMMEHVRNHAELLRRIARWLDDEGRLFVHIFCHERYAYPYEAEGKNEWMARHFFTGGVMPSWDLLTRFDDALVLDERWRVDGMHYHRTCEAWLERMDAEREAVLELFARTYGAHEARRWFERWRLFFLACSELFRFGGGREWFVGHYRFRKR